MKCEICLKANLVRHPKNFDFQYCLNCHAFYSTQNHSSRKAVMSILSTEAIDSFQGYDDSEFHKPDLQALINTIQSDLTSKNNNWLDIGCFDGRFLHFIERMGFSGYGLEIQAEMVGFCQSNELKVFQGEFPFRIPSQVSTYKFKAISSFESIYYWPDLNRCVEKIATLLDEKGYFLVKLNQGTSLYYNHCSLNERVHDFNIMLNVKALNILLQRFNFSLIAYKPYGVVWDNKVYSETNILKRSYYKLKRKILTEVLLQLRLIEKWDKVMLLYQKNEEN